LEIFKLDIFDAGHGISIFSAISSALEIMWAMYNTRAKEINTEMFQISHTICLC
jgi:hypothetical protein